MDRQTGGLPGNTKMFGIPCREEFSPINGALRTPHCWRMCVVLAVGMCMYVCCACSCVFEVVPPMVNT